MSHYGVRNKDQPAGLMTEPVLYVDLDIWQKMMAYIMACPIEIGGFGYIERIGPADFALRDVFILRQTTTAGSVDIDPIAIGEHITGMLQRGMNSGLMRFQWHSHVKMGARFSGIDLTNIEVSPGSWHVSLVANQFGEFEARLDANETFRYWSPLRVVIGYMPSDELLQQVMRDIAALVNRPQPGIFRVNRTKPVVPVVSTTPMGIEATDTATAEDVL